MCCVTPIVSHHVSIHTLLFSLRSHLWFKNRLLAQLCPRAFIFGPRPSYSAPGLHNFGHGSAQLRPQVRITSATGQNNFSHGPLPTWLWWVMSYVFFVWHSLFDCRCFHNNNFGNDAPRLRSATTGAMQQDARRLYEEFLVVTCWHLEFTKLGKCLHHFTIDVWVYDCMLACSSLLAQVCNLHTFIYCIRKGSD